MYANIGSSQLTAIQLVTVQKKGDVTSFHTFTYTITATPRLRDQQFGHAFMMVAVSRGSRDHPCNFPNRFLTSQLKGGGSPIRLMTARFT